MRPTRPATAHARGIRLSARLWSICLLVGGLFGAAPSAAKVLMTVDEALALAFPGCEVERRTVFLSSRQKAEASKLARAEIVQGLVYPYTANCPALSHHGETAYFDTHRVRTLEETVMIVVREGRVARIEVLAFREPLDYLPSERWYAQFDDQPLSDDLDLDRRVRPVAGATLTARATADAVRRVLALHEVLAAEASP